MPNEINEIFGFDYAKMTKDMMSDMDMGARALRSIARSKRGGLALEALDKLYMEGIIGKDLYAVQIQRLVDEFAGFHLDVEFPSAD